jgi:hypothetical protein
MFICKALYDGALSYDRVPLEFQFCTFPVLERSLSVAYMAEGSTPQRGALTTLTLLTM